MHTIFYYCKTISGAKRNPSGNYTVEFQGWDNSRKALLLIPAQSEIPRVPVGRPLVRSVGYILHLYLSCGLRKYNIKLKFSVVFSFIYIVYSI